jgi:sphinganine-1-phosphate aldolase
MAYASWPGGLFVSPSALGTRGGGPIAAAWTALCHLGANGYMHETKVAMDTAMYIRSQIAEIPELQVLGSPHATILAFSSNILNIFSIADVLVKFSENSWKFTIERKMNMDGP